MAVTTMAKPHKKPTNAHVVNDGKSRRYKSIPKKTVPTTKMQSLPFNRYVQINSIGSHLLQVFIYL